MSLQVRCKVLDSVPWAQGLGFRVGKQIVQNPSNWIQGLHLHTLGVQVDFQAHPIKPFTMPRPPQISGLGSRISDLGSRVRGLGFRVQCLGLGGLGLRVLVFYFILASANPIAYRRALYLLLEWKYAYPKP